MPGYVVFTKDWDDIPTSGMHIPWQLGQHEHLLWINSIGTRNPTLTSARDLRRIFERLKKLFSNAKYKKEKIWVKAPVLLPKASSGLVIAINRILLKIQVIREMKRLGISNPEVWSFVPNTGEYLDIFKPSKKVYYCVDDWPKMQSTDSTYIEQAENRLLNNSDIVFATSEHLKQILITRTRTPIYYAPHGVDYNHFSKATNESTNKPADIESLGNPIIGFIGTIDNRIDMHLVSGLLEKLPDFHFVFIGPCFADISILTQYPNFHFLGKKNYADLPKYCASFNAAIIPYDSNSKYNLSINPIKVREFLAAGLPVVASDLPALQNMEHVYIARDLDSWQSIIRKATNPHDKDQISQTVISHSWENRYKDLRRLISQFSET